jgi:hypothetical protein
MTDMASLSRLVIGFVAAVDRVSGRGLILSVLEINTVITADTAAHACAHAAVLGLQLRDFRLQALDLKILAQQTLLRSEEVAEF